MKISRYEFERELDALLNAALSASSKERADRFLKEAYNKINGYDDIPMDLQNEYRRRIEQVRDQLNL